MKLTRHRLLIGIAAAALLTCAAFGISALVSAPSVQLLHTEPSDFAPILVFEEYGQRCMNFNTIEDDGRHTCMSLENPDEMVFNYTRMMTSALFVNPSPRNVLVVGLGGATLPRALEKILPDAVIDSVEIDPAVVRVAEQFFDFQQGPRQRVFVEDGRAFVERAVRAQQHYDMVMLDAFAVDYIPARLLTRVFLTLVRDLLSPAGGFAANSFTTSHMYDRESATYAAVFGDFFNLRAEHRFITANRVIIATRGGLPDDQTLARHAAALKDTLAPFGIDAARQLQWYARDRDWDENAKILVD